MCPPVDTMMVTFLTIVCVLASIMSSISSNTPLQIKTDDSVDGWTRNQADRPIENFTSSQSLLSTWLKYHHHHEIKKRQIDMGPEERNSPFCGGRSSFCKYFYPDHPDAGRFRINNYKNQTITNNGIKEEKTNIGSNQTLSTTCEDTSSFCTYYHPDNPNAGQHRSVKENKSSKAVATNEINNEIIKNKTSMGSSNNKTLHLPTCEDISSSLCTYLYLDQHSGDGRRPKSNHTPVVATDVINDEMLKEPHKYVSHSDSHDDSDKRNSPFCEGSSPICIYFYPDHPDAGRSRKMDNYSQLITNKNITAGTTKETIIIGSNRTLLTNCEDTRLYCTYFHPDHTDTGRIRNGMQSQASTISETNTGKSQQQANISSNHSLHIKPACKDSSSFCTFDYDNSKAFQKKKSNHTPIVTILTDEMLSDSSSNKDTVNISDKKYFTSPFTTSTIVSVTFTSTSSTNRASPLTSASMTNMNPNSTGSTVLNISMEEHAIKNINPSSASTSVVSISNYSLKSTKVVVNTSTEEYFSSLPNSTKPINVNPTSPSPSAVSISNDSLKFTRGVQNSSVKEYFTSLPKISTRQSVNLTSPSTSAVSISNNSPKSTIMVETISDEDHFIDDLNINTTIRSTSISTSAVSISHKRPKSTTTMKTGPASSRNWKDGRGGSKWDTNCDFNGNDIGCITTLLDSQCMGMCLDNGDCTHLSYNVLLRKCCLKKADQMTENFHLIVSCGFIPGRSRQN